MYDTAKLIVSSISSGLNEFEEITSFAAADVTFRTFIPFPLKMTLLPLFFMNLVNISVSNWY